MDNTAHASDWAELARKFPTTGEWPLFLAPDTARWGGDEDYFSFLHRDKKLGIRGVFGLDRGERDWEIAEDDYCFECGNTHDRSGEVSVASERDDFEIVGEMDIFRWAGDTPTLVTATRPSDSLLELKWPGILNIRWAPSEASVVLRSWEERFGAVPFSASNSTLMLVVARPPMTIEDARQVAREHFHFCPYDTQFHGFGGISPYVRKLVGAREWSFWWD
jgi:hypothetical protein